MKNIKVKMTIGTDTLLQSAKQLMQKGLITKEQYTEMERKNKAVPKQRKNDVIDIKED